MLCGIRQQLGCCEGLGGSGASLELWYHTRGDCFDLAMGITAEQCTPVTWESSTEMLQLPVGIPAFQLRAEGNLQAYQTGQSGCQLFEHYLIH